MFSTGRTTDHRNERRKPAWRRGAQNFAGQQHPGNTSRVPRCSLGAAVPPRTDRVREGSQSGGLVDGASVPGTPAANYPVNAKATRQTTKPRIARLARHIGPRPSRHSRQLAGRDLPGHAISRYNSSQPRCDDGRRNHGSSGQLLPVAVHQHVPPEWYPPLSPDGGRHAARA